MRRFILTASILCFLMTLALTGCVAYTLRGVLRYDARDSIMCRNK